MKILSSIYSCLISFAAVTVYAEQFSANESVSFNLNQFVATGVYGGDLSPLYYVFGITIAQNQFDANSSFRVSLYENGSLDSPFDTATFTGGSDFTNSDVEIGFVAFASNSPNWTDLQGYAQIDVLSGSVGINEIQYGTSNNGILYTGYAAIAEPSRYTVIFGILAFVGVVLRKRIKPEKITNHCS